jgi:hypothetical protein
MTAEFLSVGQAADRLSVGLGQTVKPRQLSALLYDRELRDDFCPLVGGRRLIDPEYLSEIARVLRRKGWVRRDAVWHPTPQEAVR